MAKNIAKFAGHNGECALLLCPANLAIFLRLKEFRGQRLSYGAEKSSS